MRSFAWEVLAIVPIRLYMISIMSADLRSQLRDLRGHELSFASGQYLFHLGDQVNVMHFIEESAVQLIRYQSDGSALVLQRAGPGAILAEASLYSEAYHCDAVALASTRALVFPGRR